MKNKKIKIKGQKCLVIVFLTILLFPLISSAAGLVPCGGDGEEPCTLCHFFVLFENIVEFVLFRLVPPLAVLMLVIGGAMFFFATGSPGALSQAKSVITTTVIGLIIIYTAFLIVGMFLASIGLADWTDQIYKNWWDQGIFTIDCVTS